MLHVNMPVGENHIIHNWSYANAAARVAASGFVAADVNKLALQTDNNTFWMLTNHVGPVWQQQTFASTDALTAAAATTRTHVPTVAQIQDGALNTYTATSTTGAGVAYSITPVPTLPALVNGQIIQVYFTDACGTAPTLNINGLGAVSLYKNINGTRRTLTPGDIPAGWLSDVRVLSGTQIEVIKTVRRMVTLNVTRDVSLATGNVSYTGAGFTPRRVIVNAGINGTAAWSIGSYDSTANESIFGNYGGTAGVVGMSTSSCGTLSTTAIDFMQIGWASFDADGITLTYTKTSNPTGTANISLLLEE